jgi:MFS family permease
VFTRAPGTEDRRGWLIFLGLTGIAAGVLTFIWPDITALALLFVIAAWAFVIGVVEIGAAVRLRRVLPNEWLLGLLGALSITFAIALVITPGAGALVITWFIGWYALLSGVVRLALAWRLRKVENELEVRPPAAGSASGRRRPDGAGMTVHGEIDVVLVPLDGSELSAPRPALRQGAGPRAGRPARRTVAPRSRPRPRHPRRPAPDPASPAEGVRTSRSWRDDPAALVVVGSRARTSIFGLAFESVAAAIVHHSPAPVMVVPRRMLAEPDARLP